MRTPCLVAVSAALVVCSACRQPPPPTVAVRLVDTFRPEAVSGRAASSGDLTPRALWRFTEPAPDAPEALRSTYGWEAGPGVTGLQVRDGHLAGRTTTAFPFLHVARTSGGDADLLHAIEVRLRVSKGTRLQFAYSREEKVDFAKAVQNAKDDPQDGSTPIVAGSEMRTYSLRLPEVTVSSDIRHVLLRPTDAAEATFEIESFRLVLRKEHLASIASGVSWQGLSGIFHESLVARSPETIRMTLTLPERPWLDMAVGTVEDGPVGFRVEVAPAADARNPKARLAHTVTTPHRWERMSLDLAALGGEQVVVSLSLDADPEGALGFWGAPAFRSRDAMPRPESGGDGIVMGTAPQGVILIWADTLRRDHLDVYGYKRPTAPLLRRMAGEGTLFRNCLTQATWTKVSTPSLVTSLYPTSHGITTWDDRLPSSAVTLAEVYRAAGYATFSYASNNFTGTMTNLHQGFERMDEEASLLDRRSNKTARVGMDRLFEWLDDHRDGPFFAFLSVLDPHDPYKPYKPYDTLWADPAKEREHVRQTEAVRKHIVDPGLKRFGMPNRKELLAAKLDPEAYVAHDRDWYDGAIRGLDTEVGRLLERLRALGLESRTLVVFTGDHGEEFLEHGQMFHGQSAYGELNSVPLLVWSPGRVAPGAEVSEVVETIDLMPTLLSLSRLRGPEGMQGRSLVPLLAAAREGKKANGGKGRAAGPGAAGWTERPAITERLVARDDKPPLDTESVAIVAGGWKLIHNPRRHPPTPEYELFDFAHDPLDATNVAAAHPDVVERLAREIEAWRIKARTARLKPDAESAKTLDSEELERLRALGYVQ